MPIAQNDYYINLTKALRTDALKDSIRFTNDGFSYMTNTLALVMRRESKNNYVVILIYSNTYERRSYSSCAKAVEWAQKAIWLDLEGYLRR